MNPIRIATRGSRLALVQADLVKRALLARDPRLDISLVIISTKGDQDPADFLYKSQSVGFFTSEVEKALLDGAADLAVHSLKDLPTAPAPGLVLAAVPLRDSPADALIAPVSSLADLPPGAVVGTSSLRRLAQLKLLRNDLRGVPLRGNVETRIAKVESRQIDAAIVACAGMNRLGLSHKIAMTFPPEDFIPAPAQGALALQIRSDDQPLQNLLAKLDHPETRLAVEAERAILAAMKGGCSIPLGVYASVRDDALTIRAFLSDPDARTVIRKTQSAPLDQANRLAADLAMLLLETGGREILARLRSSDSPPTPQNNRDG